MTEQEGQLIAERLTRIWTPKSVAWKIAPLPLISGLEGFLYLNASLCEGLRLGVEGHRWGAFSFGLLDETWAYGLDCDEQGQLDQSHFLYPDATQEALMQSQFAAQWLNFFRRGCWLSGCAIEATAHEKVEWIQGFSREEVEAWNLKL